MIYMAKATKNRLDSVIENPVSVLAIAGPQGAGKTTLARHLASNILRINEARVEEAPNVKIITGTSKDAIDSVREAQQFFLLRTIGSDDIRRCLVITDIDNFGHPAQNALLKMLEEPPEDAMIIVTVSDKTKLLQTVKSRLSWLQVGPLTLDEAKQAFTQIYSDPQITKAWHMSSGYAGLMAGILHQDNTHPLVVAVEQAKQTLGQTTFERLLSVDVLIKDKNFSLITFLDAMHRLLTSALKISTTKNNQDTLKLAEQIKTVLYAKEQALNHVQPKLLLTEMFYSL